MIIRFIYHLTGEGHNIFDLANYASHVCRSGKLLSQLLSIYCQSHQSYDLTSRHVRHTCSLQHQTFCALHLWGDNWPHSQIKTANWSTYQHHTLIPSVSAVIFQLCVQLTWGKLNVFVIGLQTEKLQALHCEFSQKYSEWMFFFCVQNWTCF